MKTIVLENEDVKVNIELKKDFSTTISKLRFLVVRHSIEMLLEENKEDIKEFLEKEFGHYGMKDKFIVEVLLVA